MKLKWPPTEWGKVPAPEQCVKTVSFISWTRILHDFYSIITLPWPI